jgi:exodeoxyribonuclease VII large subunit
LWSFNEEQVARAIAASEIPVISAVGHEIDYTIADFVADLRASTPSAAAELVVKSEAELRQQINALVARMHTVVQSHQAQAQQALDHLFNSRPLRQPHRFVETLQQQVDDLMLQLEKGWQNTSQERDRRLQNATRSLARLNPRVRWQRLYTHLTSLERRLQNAAQSRLTRQGDMLGGLSSRLHALSPLAVLGRGYSLCRDPISQQLVSRAALVHAGQQIEVLLQDGQLTCTVDDIDAKEPNYGRTNLRTGFETP